MMKMIWCNSSGVFRLFFLFLSVFTITSLIMCPHALAHKVNIFAYVDDNTVITESYFNDGKACINARVIVTDGEGAHFIEGTTDKEGKFVFETPTESDLKIVVDAGMGHRGEYVLSASEMPGAAEIGHEHETSMEGHGGEHRETGYISEECREQIEPIIEEALDRRLGPVMDLLKKSVKQGPSITEVAGGIGYIIGILGLWMFFLSRKNKK